NRGSLFAKNNKVYLLMALGTIEPGTITEGKNFIENKAIIFGPDGKMLNDFRKNHPVPFAEHSAPGDGKIPVLETPYGKISSSICYDADFPQSMQQLSKNKTGLLLLPSSDWYAISPYHSYIAVFRAIENGSSVIRQAAGGLSLASDYRGKIIAQKNFFDEGEKLMIANVPIKHVTTIYSVIGDSFAFICIVFIIIAVVILMVKTIKTRKVKN
ncbi:MAG: nitrilase-related carbon-nitrogen hydrolase, partial [Panacibacter sp.]